MSVNRFIHQYLVVITYMFLNYFSPLLAVYLKLRKIAKTVIIAVIKNEITKIILAMLQIK